MALGDVKVGDTQATVLMAFGQPNEIRELQTESGPVVQWIYDPATLMGEVIVPPPVRVDSAQAGTMEQYPYSYFDDTRVVRADIEKFPGFIVEFREGRVSAFECCKS
jgi:hypothetical protein